jgi:hypothetical protein
LLKSWALIFSILVVCSLSGRASAQVSGARFHKPTEGVDAAVPLSGPAGALPVGAAESDTADAMIFENNRIDTFHYRVPKKRFELEVSAQSPTSSTMTRMRDGGPLYDHTYSSIEGEAGFSYGISDRLLVRISENYLFNEMDTETYHATGSVQKYQLNGPSNPSLRLDYRFLGSLNGYAFSSVFVDYSPSTGNEINASSAGAGNHLPGLTSADVGFNLYWVDNAHEWFGLIYVTYQTAGTVDTPTVSNYETFNSAVRYESDFGYRYHFLKNGFVSGYLNFRSGYTLSEVFPTQSPVFTQDSDRSFVSIESVDLGWRTSEKTLVRISFSYQSATENLTPTSITPTSFDSEKSQRQNLTLGGLVEF